MQIQSLRGLLLVALLVASPQVLTAQQDSLTIGLIGDSTVADTYGWGPAFAKRFNNNTQVLNYARNGATLNSLSRRFDELLKQKPDVVLIQFGHNDQKRYGTDVYQNHLNSYVQRAREAGSKVIILSSVTRRNFDKEGKIQLREENLKGNLATFAKAAAKVAKEQQLTFIDLHSISIEHHNKLGPEATAAYNFSESDTTHFSEAGANATADLIITELRSAAPELAPYLLAK
ncbi:Rhamnogalacturonan acetylesterase RhgT [Roseimaritima multifibrata]|uniref:Rhamnogalacturonan acetylesterase RhgT n=1 Tax=Roseimaritima multifibrata TaxID=1930274 RepID=A0A517MLD4_9BACT|nr:GDSL-type esterase/lipase family protein [Roseimaritima multifibrata]QDS95692.1 Rhamnogalacturonan acetylesterase RhgT [Roseimaritima multifibrata]